MAESSALDRQTIRVLDADGTPLTTAMARAEDDDGAVVLTEIDDPGTMIHYYFGRGQRLVMLETPALRPYQPIEGALETWWIAGARVWKVYVDRPLVTLGPVGTVQLEPAARR